jgi:hypothetical protein
MSKVYLRASTPQADWPCRLHAPLDTTPIILHVSAKITSLIRSFGDPHTAHNPFSG